MVIPSLFMALQQKKIIRLLLAHKGGDLALFSNCIQFNVIEYTYQLKIDRLSNHHLRN